LIDFGATAGFFAAVTAALRVVFFAAVFLAAVFFAAVFFAVVFLAAVFRVVFFVVFFAVFFVTFFAVFFAGVADASAVGRHLGSISCSRLFGGSFPSGLFCRGFFRYTLLRRGFLGGLLRC